MSKHRKYWIIGLVALGCAAGRLSAAGVNLYWNPPTQNADGSPLCPLAGYRVYYGVAGAPYAYCQDVGLALQTSIGGLTQGISYHFVVAAYSSGGTESALSPDMTSMASTNGGTTGSLAPVLTGINRDGAGGVTVSWSSVAGEVYALQRTFSLAEPFQTCISNISATPPVNASSDATFGSTNNAAFYRVVITP